MTRVRISRGGVAVLSVLAVLVTVVPAARVGARLSSKSSGVGSVALNHQLNSIELVNPSDYTATQHISDKMDIDQAYHFVAWVDPVGVTNAQVEFDIQLIGPGDVLVGNPQTICLGVRVTATPDTWECFWQIPQAFPPGDYRLRARFFSGLTELDRDAARVQVHEMFGQQETVEILSPSNGGQIGFFTSGGATRFAIEAQTSDLNGIGGFARPFYATTAPGHAPDGDEMALPADDGGANQGGPSWTACGPYQQVPNDRRVRMVCTLQGVDNGADVTAVAVVANETFPPAAANPALDQSGDAHRVTAVQQIPTTIDITPASQTVGKQGDTWPCTTFQIEVRDQANRAVIGASVDAHATGPSDQLRFGNVNPSGTSPFQAPDQGGTGHTTENAFNCNNGTDQGLQGDHNVPAGNDTKHIESVGGGGTDVRGRLLWALRSPDAGGTTSLEAWIDSAQDDVRTFDEPVDTATITWAPGPGPSPSPSPSPSASPSPSPSPTVSPSPSPTVSPTASPTPSPTVSPTRSPTPSPTASPTPTQFDRTITLESSAGIKKFNRVFSLSGSVRSQSGAPAACNVGATVQILRDVLGGSDNFQNFRTDTTDSSGFYSVDVNADQSAQYIARVDASPTCDEATSSPETILVRKLVRFSRSPRVVNEGGRVRFHIEVDPCSGHQGDRVQLQKGRRGGFGTVATKRTNSSCEANFFRRLSKSNAWRGRSPKSDSDHEGGTSSQKFVRVRR